MTSRSDLHAIPTRALRAEMRRRELLHRDPVTKRKLYPIRAERMEYAHNGEDCARRLPWSPGVRVVHAEEDERMACACLWCGDDHASLEEPMCYPCRIQERADAHRRARHPEHAAKGERYAQGLRKRRATG